MGWLEEQYKEYPFVEKIDKFLEAHDFARYGPAHIVLDDYNLLDSHIEICLRDIDNILVEGVPPEYHHHPGYHIDLLDGARDVLVYLLTVPERERIAFMEEYAGDTTPDQGMAYTEAIRRIQHLFLQDGDVIVVKVRPDAPPGYIEWLLEQLRKENIAEATDKKVSVLVLRDFVDIEVRDAER